MIESHLLYLVGGLIVVYLTHLLFKEREKRAQFESAANKLRSNLNLSLVELAGEFLSLEKLDLYIKEQKSTALNFKPYLQKRKVKLLEDACNEYYTYYDDWRSGLTTHDQILYNLSIKIKDIIKFTY